MDHFTVLEQESGGQQSGHTTRIINFTLISSMSNKLINTLLV